MEAWRCAGIFPEYAAAGDVLGMSLIWPKSPGTDFSMAVDDDFGLLVFVNGRVQNQARQYKQCSDYSGHGSAHCGGRRRRL